MDGFIKPGDLPNGHHPFTEESDSWDPFREAFISVKNLNCNHVQESAQGLPEYKGTLCPHANDEKGCFKGKLCPYEHHIDQKMVRANPKMAVPEEHIKLCHWYRLPEKNLLPGHSIFLAKVVRAVSPDEFYIIPRHPTQCLCLTEGEARPVVFDKMVEDFKEYYTKYEFKNALSFVNQQLVVVKAEFGGIASFWRAVTDDNLLITEDSIPSIRCFFLDLGCWFRIEMNNMAPMPKNFSKLPPLAYKCSLSGVSPMFVRYPTSLNRLFQELVLGKEVLVHMKKVFDPLDSELGLIEADPYSVEVRVSFSNDTQAYLDVKEELVKTGTVLEWSVNPNRPIPWRGMSHNEVGLLLPESAERSSTRKHEKQDRGYAKMLWHTAKSEVKKKK